MAKFYNIEGVYVDMPSPNILRTTSVKVHYAHKTWHIDCRDQHIKQLSPEEKEKLIKQLQEA
jgi:uncharacterized protein (DUF111 family)